jgi:hypothetical protein
LLGFNRYQKAKSVFTRSEEHKIIVQNNTSVFVFFSYVCTMKRKVAKIVKRRIIEHKSNGIFRCAGLVIESDLPGIAVAVAVAVSLRMKDFQAARVADGKTYVDFVAPEP